MLNQVSVEPSDSTTAMLQWIEAAVRCIHDRMIDGKPNEPPALVSASNGDPVQSAPPARLTFGTSLLKRRYHHAPQEWNAANWMRGRVRSWR